MPCSAQHRRDVVATLEQHRRARIDPGVLQHAVDDGGERAVGGQRLAAALEQDGVAALPGQPHDLHQRVGARLEHHAEQAQRAAHPLQHQPVVELAPQGHLPDEIGHGRQLLEPVADAVELGRVEPQALDQRRGDAFGLGARQVLGVHLEDRRRAPPARAAPRPARAAAPSAAPGRGAPACRRPPWPPAPSPGSPRSSPSSPSPCCSSDCSHDQVVARDERVVAAPPEDRVDVVAVPPRQLAAGVGGVVHQAPPVDAPAAVADLDDVALFEGPLDADHADRQQRRLLLAVERAPAPLR